MLYVTAALIIVTTVAAARSTWSPCGLSMLSSITPVSEQAKGNSYRVTATWFVVGTTVGGASLGMVMAMLADGVHALHMAVATLCLLALGAALVAAVSDSGIAGARLPIHRRQVNERWLDQYRAWVYGTGFGWQIGAGLATYITSAAVYLMIALGALTASPVVALAAGTGFGLLRGLAVLLTRGLRDPAALRAFHRRFVEAGPWVGRAVVIVEVGTAVGLFVAVQSLSAAALVVVILGLTAAGLAVATGRSRVGALARAVPTSAGPGPAASSRGGV